MERISKYLTYAEATASATAQRLGIPNTPTPDDVENMKHVATRIFDRVREHLGGPLHASSFYRSPKLNQSLANQSGLASLTSQHMKGEAIDITTRKFGIGTNRQVFDFIRNHCEFDQLIWEFGTDHEPDWVHVSLKRNGGNRKKVLRAYYADPASKKGVKYVPFQNY